MRQYILIWILIFKPAEWINEWTEENATTFCHDFFSNRKSVDSCKGTIEFIPENAIENCIEDIFVSYLSQ